MEYRFNDLMRFQNRTEQQVNYKNLTRYGSLKKKDILIKLYSKQRISTELKTSLAVENSRKLIVAEIEKLFKVKYNQVPKLINKLSTSKVCGFYDCSSLIVSMDIKEITSIMEDILQKQLEKRFLISSHTSLDLDYQPSQLFNLIENCRRTKNRSLFTTQQVEKCSKTFLHKAVNINFPSEALLQVVKKSNLSSNLLKSLEIDARKEQAEYLIELRKRLEGCLDAIKLRMIIDIKQKVAHVYYQIHDEIIDRRFSEKITLLEKGRTEEETYSLMRRGA